MRHLERVASYEDFRRIARRRLPRAVFEFIDGGCGAERALADATEAFARVRFEPRWLVDVSRCDAATTVLGQRVEMPICLAPAGMGALFHPDAELAAARAASKAGTIFCLSAVSTRSIEEVAEVASGPLWLQLFPWRSDRDLARLIERARAAGYRALLLTVDAPVGANRERDLRNGVRIPPKLRFDTVLDGMRRSRWVFWYYTRGGLTLGNVAELAGTTDLGACAAYLGRELIDPAATWERLDFVRRHWDGPLAVKGVLSARDAHEAVVRGADAVCVSNHGGRQLDSTLAPLDALPVVVEAIGDRAEVLVDGGVRRGADAVKARALGARATLIGRPWAMSLAAGGQPAVERALELLASDVARTLALVGVPRFDAVDGTILAQAPQSRSGRSLRAVESPFGEHGAPDCEFGDALRGAPS